MQRLKNLRSPWKIAALIRDEGPDIAHLHSICHQLSPLDNHPSSQRRDTHSNDIA